MSDVALASDMADSPFRGRTVALMLVMGVVGFIGMLVLGAFAPDMRSGQNGGGHALSNGATGFSALVQMAQATGRRPRIVRDPHQFDTEDLLVLTPESGAVDISAALRGREAKPTLFILPKWRTAPDPDHRGWVRHGGLLPIGDPTGVLAPAFTLRLAQYRSGGGWLRRDAGLRVPPVHGPRPLQAIRGIALDKAGRGDPDYRAAHRLRPLLSDGRGGIVLAQIGEGPLFVLADPDLLDNRGMKDVRQAAAALALLDWMNSTGNEGIAFDVSLNGFGHSQSPLKLLFEPPFLAMTLAIAATLLLVGLHALGRFGPARPRVRAIPFGKAALVDNSAALIAKAGREAAMGGRYAAVIRDRAVHAFGVPARLRDNALDAYLDGLSGAYHFTDLARAAAESDDRASLLAAAQALHQWQREKMR